MTTLIIIAGLLVAAWLLLGIGGNAILTNPGSLSVVEIERIVRANQRLMPLEEAGSPRWTECQRKIAAGQAELDRRNSPTFAASQPPTARKGWGANMGLNLLAGFVIIALILGGIIGWDYLDGAFYTPVWARIATASDICRLRHGTGRYVSYSKDMDCEAARAAQARDGGDVVADRSLTYTYVSPWDGQSHDGALRLNAGQYGQAGPGDSIRIGAHRFFAGTSREIRLFDRPEIRKAAGPRR